MTFTVLPFLVAFAIGLAQMTPLDIYAVNAWNVGTARVEPWRVRGTSLHRAVASVRSWLAELMRPRLIIAIALALIVAWLLDAALPHAPGVALAAITLGTPAEMRERREKLIRDAGDLMGSNNTFDKPEKREQFDAMMTDVEAYRVALEDGERRERLDAMSRQGLPESQRQQPREETDETRRRTLEVRNRALNLYLRGVAMGDMPAEERSALQGSYRQFTAEEQRDMSTYSAANGGIVVAPDTRFFGTILQAMKFFGGMEAAGAEVFNTDTAGPLPIPMGDDTGNVGAIVAEAAAAGHAGGTSPTLTALILGGYLYSSKVVKVSWQMLRDGAINVEGYVGGLLGERLARIQNTHMTSTGTGSGMPQALTATAAVGRQSATGNTTSVPFDDIYRTIHSVDVAYRTPEAKWMFHDNSALVLRLAKDGQGRYLWPEMGSVQSGQPASLAGYNFVVNNDMPTMAASAKWASFGQHKHYKIRRINGITIVRINELYVESGQVGFLAFQSADGGYANPGQNPVKLLQNSAS